MSATQQAETGRVDWAGLLAAPSIASVTLNAEIADAIAGEVRAELARRGSSIRAFAQQLDVPEHWAVRRLSAARSVPLTLEDVAVIARALGMRLADLLP